MVGGKTKIKPKLRNEDSGFTHYKLGLALQIHDDKKSIKISHSLKIMSYTFCKRPNINKTLIFL